MKDLIFRDWKSEQRLRKAMLQQARGVPAEGLRRYRWLGLWSVFRSFLALFFLGIIVLTFSTSYVASPVGRSANKASLLSDFGITASSIFFAGLGVVSLGNRLLLPPHGLALAHTPVSNKKVLTPLLFRLGIYLACPVLMVTFLNLPSRSVSGAIMLTACWMSIPVAAISWQIFNQGRSGSFLLWTGGALGVVAYLFLVLRSFNLATPSSGRCLSRLTYLFWQKHEKELGKLLGRGIRYNAGWKSLAVLIALLIVHLIPLLWTSLAADIKTVLEFSVPPVAILVLICGWKSEVIQMAFSKFRLPNKQWQAVCLSLPVSEKLLFRMYLKEALAVFCTTFPLQTYAAWLMYRVVEKQLSVQQLILLGAFLFLQFFSVRLFLWIRHLSESLSLFQPGFRGTLLGDASRLLLVGPPLVFFFVGATQSISWLFATGKIDIASLFYFLQLSWLVGACWLVRWAANTGKGSAVVTLKKKRKSFRLG